MKKNFIQILVGLALIAGTVSLFYFTLMYQPEAEDGMVAAYPQASATKIILSNFFDRNGEGIPLEGYLIILSPIAVILGVFISRKAGLHGLYRDRADILRFISTCLIVILMIVSGYFIHDLIIFFVISETFITFATLIILINLVINLFFMSLVYLILHLILKKYLNRIAIELITIFLVWASLILFSLNYIESDPIKAIFGILFFFLTSWVYLRRGYLSSLGLSLLITSALLLLIGFTMDI
jgi:hypothetical protein